MNKCNCDNPPGGSVTCPDGQIPICRVQGGSANGYCLAPPSDLTGLELTAWFLTHLVGKDITTGEVMAKREFQAAILDGRFVNKATGEVITFTIPHSIHMPIPALAQARA
jgi:hypothetical protein